MPRRNSLRFLIPRRNRLGSRSKEMVSPSHLASQCSDRQDLQSRVFSKDPPPLQVGPIGNHVPLTRKGVPRRKRTRGGGLRVIGPSGVMPSLGEGLLRIFFERLGGITRTKSSMALPWGLKGHWRLCVSQAKSRKRTRPAVYPPRGPWRCKIHPGKSLKSDQTASIKT